MIDSEESQNPVNNNQINLPGINRRESAGMQHFENINQQQNQLADGVNREVNNNPAVVLVDREAIRNIKFKSLNVCTLTETKLRYLLSDVQNNPGHV